MHRAALSAGKPFLSAGPIKSSVPRIPLRPSRLGFFHQGPESFDSLAVDEAHGYSQNASIALVQYA